MNCEICGEKATVVYGGPDVQVRLGKHVHENAHLCETHKMQALALAAGETCQCVSVDIPGMDQYCPVCRPSWFTSALESYVPHEGDPID